MTQGNSHDLTRFRSAGLKGPGSEMQGDLPRDANFPNFDSVEIMRTVDSMKPKWRALVHEYGLKQVLGCLEDGLSLADADDALWMGRSARQAQWMATDFITKRSQKAWGQ